MQAMDAKQYLEQFDLTPEEMKLQILNCGTINYGTSGFLAKNLKNMTELSSEQLFKLKLPFTDQNFNLALCYNTLFVAEQEDDKQTLNFYLGALLELARVAGEVRIYPVVNKQGQPSQHLGPVLKALQDKGLGVELRQLKHNHNHDANHGAMLRVWNASCQLE